jgi:citrate lyase subunit beta/citryl-CoA lyase
MVSLIVPGSSERMLAKAGGLAVAEVVVDLEDAVVVDRKADALAMTVRALASGFTAARTAVRVNPPGSAWFEDEIRTLAAAPVPPDSIVVPKVARPLDIEGHFGVQALIETAEGLANIAEIAGGSAGLEALILGYADLAVSLGRTPAGSANLDLWLGVQDMVLVAARAAGLRAIDGPFLSLADEVGLTASASRAAELGFDGKWAIHPAQVNAIEAAFRPTPEAVQRARSVIDALRRAEADGAGAVSFEGVMLDEPVRLAALRTLALAGESA